MSNELEKDARKFVYDLAHEKRVNIAAAITFNKFSAIRQQTVADCKAAFINAIKDSKSGFLGAWSKEEVITLIQNTEVG